MARILIVTDRPQDLLVLQRGLESGGHAILTSGFESATEASAEASVAVVDAVKDLLRARDLCRALHAADARQRLIAVVSPETVDAIGPDWELDTFLVEPAGVSEALARIRLALGPQLTESPGTVRVGELSIDPETYQVRVRGRPLDLTYKEFQLLFFLARHPGRVFSRQQLLQEVWGYDFFGGTRTVDVHVRRLRAKLGAEHEGMIATIRNVGYKLEAHRSR